ncbi:mucin-15 [Pseudorasbora parva]|uniref:mucin-15 n=1 Tax=Pseudorasbora parva TaxID=51549 RepID=UPI00351E0D34
MGGMLRGPAGVSGAPPSREFAPILQNPPPGKFEAEVWFTGEHSGKASFLIATARQIPPLCHWSLDAHSLNSQTFQFQPRTSHPSPADSTQVEESNMKLPLGITLTLLLILQTFEQVSTQGPDENKENTKAEPESNLEGDGQSFGSFTFIGGDEQQQNSTKPDNDTEEFSTGKPITTTLPTMIALNSSSEFSYTSAESNETQIQETVTKTSTPEPEHTNQSALNETYTSPKPENTTTESSLDETGSGYLPSDDVSTNSTTSPTTTTTDGSIQNKTTVSPTEPPLNRTTTLVIESAIPEDITTAVPDSENTEANLTGPFDSKDNSERGLSSDVTDATESKKGQAWTIVLAVGIVVGIIALTAFIIMNRRNRRDFSHRKLVDEMSPDPVLRLDNSEPLDLKFDGFGYYNAGLQGDNIQMTNFPQGRSQ